MLTKPCPKCRENRCMIDMAMCYECMENQLRKNRAPSLYLDERRYDDQDEEDHFPQEQ